MRIVIIAAIVFAFLIGCQEEVSQTQSQATASVKVDAKPFQYNPESLTEPVQVTLKVVDAASGRPKLVGETNLPDSMELMASVSNTEFGYEGQTRVAVKNGRFESEVFGNKGQPLSEGQYVASLVMPIPSVQPEAVQAAIGENGEHLTGPLITSDDLGKSLSIKETFIVGKNSETAIEAQIQKSTKNQEIADKVSTEIKALLEISNQLIYLHEKGQEQKCVQMLRPALDRARENRKLADSLPNNYFLLGVAAGETVVCLTCLNPDIAICNQARNSMQEYDAGNWDEI